LQGFLGRDGGAEIGADARRLSAIIVVSGTIGDECLDDHRPVAAWTAEEGARKRASGDIESFRTRLGLPDDFEPNFNLVEPNPIPA
jgi:hypothetical protein